MGVLAAAGCAWSARSDPGYGGKWAWLARRGRCTASSWAQRVVRVNWGLCFVGLMVLWRTQVCHANSISFSPVGLTVIKDCPVAKKAPVRHVGFL